MIIGVISAENSMIVRSRMEKLQIDEIHLGIQNKLAIYENIKEKYKLNDSQICFCGDDFQDIEVLEKVQLSCCPSNAQDEVKKKCTFESKNKGGEGFVRDVSNLILKWKTV